MHKINLKHVGKHNRKNTPVLGTGIIAKGLGSTRLKNPQLWNYYCTHPAPTKDTLNRDREII